MNKKINIRWQLVIYDVFILIMVDLLLLVFSGSKLSVSGMVIQGAIGLSLFLHRDCWEAYTAKSGDMVGFNATSDCFLLMRLHLWSH